MTRPGRIVKFPTSLRGIRRSSLEQTDGLLTDVHFPADSTQDIAFDYDALGRLIQVSDKTGTATSEYDDLGIVIEAVRTYAGKQAQTFTYDYYPDGNRSDMAGPGGNLWHYVYNDAGLCSQMSHTISGGTGAGTVDYTYHGNGALASRQITNASQSIVSHTSYAYNPLGLLETLVNKTSSTGSTRSSYDLSAAGSYDGVFNMKAMVASITGLSSLSGIHRRNDAQSATGG